jgi:glycosyltransferase involved in cell wall biosynthesis
MRVGFDARWYNNSGVGTYIAGLLPALVRAGCEMVIYIDPRHPVPGLQKPSIETVPVSSGKYSPLGSFEFRGLEKRDNLDLFHCPFYAAPLLRGPVVVTIHDLIPFLFPVYSLPKRKMVQSGYRLAAQRAAHVITDSRITAIDVEKILGVAQGKVSPIHLAADRDVFHPCGDADDMKELEREFGIRPPYVAVATANNWRTKNLKSALQALALAHQSAGMEFQVVMFGSSGSPEFPNSVEARNLNVTRLGYVKPPDLATLFRNAHAFIMPSLYEGFGLPLVEAMSCGCPVITSNRGSLPEVAGTGAQCFDAFDIQAMAAAVVRLLRSPDELKQKRSDALRRAADFSWDRTAQATLSVYHLVNRSVSNTARLNRVRKRCSFECEL